VSEKRTHSIHIGIDFDNTIVGYDHVFLQSAKENKLILENFSGGKKDVRDHILARENGFEEWMRLQGQVYGRQISKATMIDGVAGFMRECREREIPMSVISHKTEHPHFDPETNLQKVAFDWMVERGFFENDGFALKPENVHFEVTRTLKVERIAFEKCSHFVDDLVEIFEHPSFPEDVQSYLLSAECERNCSETVTVCGSWREIEGAIFG